jgi:hypothetical protein
MVEIIKGTETPVTKFFSSPLETNNERTLKVALEVFTQLANTLKQERDEAREALMRIEQLFIDGTDIYADREAMGLIARDALEGAK